MEFIFSLSYWNENCKSIVHTISIAVQIMTVCYNFKECLQRGEFPSTCGVIQSLREICNEPFLKDAPSSSSLPKWCFLDQEPPKPFTSILGYDPLANISLDQVNLVFLTQELTTTGMLVMY